MNPRATRLRGKSSALICVIGLTLSAGLTLSGSLAAQNYENPGLGELPVTLHPQDYKPLGIRAGSFMLHPGVQLAGEYNDNVFYTADNEISDTIWHLRPYITAQSNWNRHGLNVRLAADIARYNDFGFRDYEDYFLLVNGRVDVRNRSYFSYTADYMDLHEELGSRDAEQGLEPTRYSLYGAGLGYDHTFNRLSIGVLYSLRWLDFDNAVSFEDGIIDNQDRDRDESTASVRLGYQFQTDKQAFISLQSNQRNYDQNLDRNGLNRNSDGWTANAGLMFSITGILQGDVFVSYHDEQFDDPTLPDISGWAGGMGLQWKPTSLTSVAARVTSGIEATTDQFSSGYLRTLYSVRVDHELLRHLQISAQMSYSDNDYQLTASAPPDARSNDEIWQAGLGLTYFINRFLFLSAAYTRDSLSSNVPNDKYDVNRLWLTLSFER